MSVIVEWLEGLVPRSSISGERYWTDKSGKQYNLHGILQIGMRTFAESPPQIYEAYLQRDRVGRKMHFLDKSHRPEVGMGATARRAGCACLRFFGFEVGSAPSGEVSIGTEIEQLSRLKHTEFARLLPSLSSLGERVVPPQEVRKFEEEERWKWEVGPYPVRDDQGFFYGETRLEIVGTREGKQWQQLEIRPLGVHKGYVVLLWPQEEGRWRVSCEWRQDKERPLGPPADVPISYLDALAQVFPRIREVTRCVEEQNPKSPQK